MLIEDLSRYTHWIKQRLAAADPFAKCSEWTLEMQAAFPELQRVAGEVLLSNGLNRHHWWLKTENETIIDPTAEQFQQDYFGGARIIHYTKIPEEQRPTGKCFNCGEYCYGGRTQLCSDACEHAYADYVNNVRVRVSATRKGA